MPVDPERSYRGGIARQSAGRSTWSERDPNKCAPHLGVTRTHSRPHVSDDNPCIEAHFKTLKYCPSFPGRFGSIADARAFCETFFNYYNHDHRHSGIGYHTPASVHYGTAEEVRTQRTETLEAAYTANPARFRHRTPQLPTVAWINEPEEALVQNG